MSIYREEKNAVRVNFFTIRGVELGLKLVAQWSLSSGVIIGQSGRRCGDSGLLCSSADVVAMALGPPYLISLYTENNRNYIPFFSY